MILPLKTNLKSGKTTVAPHYIYLIHATKGINTVPQVCLFEWRIVSSSDNSKKDIARHVVEINQKK